MASGGGGVVNTLVLCIQEALNRPWETKLQLVSRKGNMAADRLAKMAHQPRFEVTVYEEPLVECIGVLQRDEIM
ncbi:hypothetical protein V6N13_020266 [Hibiscus sabdariffa]